jgi:hypothetical protein
MTPLVLIASTGIAGGGISSTLRLFPKENKLRNRLGTGLLALTFLLAGRGFAQIDTGVISGRVTDPSGAVVPAAQVTIVQTDSNTESKSETNSDGVYRVPSLRPGPYRVSVTAAGFKASVRDGLTLRIGENLGLDVKLDVGAVTESINVTNSLPLLETQTSSTGQVMAGEYLYQLPNYQHWEKGVLYYTPQVQHSNAAWPGSLSNWSINGGNNYQIGYFEDGQLATTMNGGTTLNSVSVGVEEVKVLTSALPAEYGHATTGLISVVKTGGTNTLHGTGGELFKSTPMVHRPFFQLTTLPQQGVTQLFQQPDFMLSGPVYIPKLYNGKNKTFFEVAGSYHIDQNTNQAAFTVPTAAELSGDFNFPGTTPNQIFDPASTTGTFAAGNLARTPFPNNQIPASRFSSMWNAIVANKPFAAPQSGTGIFTPTGPSNNINSSAVGKYYNITTQARLDHSFTDRLKMFGSYSTGQQHQPGINSVVTYAPLDANQLVTYTIQNVTTIGLTYTLSPTLISETRVGEYRQTNNPRTTAPDDQFAFAKTVPNLPATVYLNPLNVGFGLGQGNNQGKYGNGGLGQGTLSVAVNNNHQVRQDFTKVWGTHSFKFGYEWLWQNYVAHNIGNPRLTLNFGGASGNSQTDATMGIGPTGTAIPNTGGIALANAMLGYVTSYSYAQQGASTLPEDSIHSFYFQDDWRLLPKLTLNLGLRYSTESPPHSKFPGQLSNGSLTVPDAVYPQSVPGVITCPPGGCMGGWIQPKGNIYNRDNNNFQPRFGLAYNLEQNTVIRAGFALMTLDQNLGYTTQNEIGGGSFFQQNVAQQPNVYTPLFSINQGVPAFVPNPTLPNGTIPTTASSPSGRGTLTVFPSNYHNPYTLNWNISIQHALKKDYLLELDYVGTHNVGFGGSINLDSRPYGTGLDANGNVIDLTQPANWAYRNTWTSNSSAVNGTQAYKPYPNWNQVNMQCNCVSMIYHSGTIKLEKRYSYGLSFLTFATWQKGLTTNWNSQNEYQPISVGRSVTGITQKYRFTSSMTYELPFGKGRRFMNHGRLKDWLFGGYSLSWNFSVWAPSALSTSYTGASYLNPVTGVLGGRQDYPGYEPEPGSQAFLLQAPALRNNWQDLGGNRYAQSAQNPLVTNCGTAIPNWGNNCVVVAPSFTNGNMPVNMWRPERIIGANASMYKDFPIKERFKAQLRLDFFNPFKWYNWNTLVTAMSQTQPALFGTIPLGDFGDSNEGGPPEMQISFRIKF